MDSTNGIASIDQSKLSTLGHTKIHTLRTGSKLYVRNLVMAESESDAGLSEGANSGGLFPMNTIRKATKKNPITARYRIPSRIFLFPSYKKKRNVTIPNILSLINIMHSNIKYVLYVIFKKLYNVIKQELN